MDEELAINLKVKKSKITGRSGTARVHQDIFEHLRTEKGKSEVRVFREDGRAILVKITGDRLIDKELISLRKEDLARLEIEEGDVVSLRVHHGVMDSLGDLKDKIVSKFKKTEDEEEGDDANGK